MSHTTEYTAVQHKNMRDRVIRVEWKYWKHQNVPIVQCNTSNKNKKMHPKRKD